MALDTFTLSMVVRLVICLACSFLFSASRERIRHWAMLSPNCSLYIFDSEVLTCCARRLNR